MAKVYLNSLSGLKEGKVSAAQRVANTSAINAALKDGAILRMRAGSYVEIASTLILPGHAGIICDEAGVRPILHAPAEHFTYASTDGAGRYGADACMLKSRDAVAPQLCNIHLQFEVADHRSLYGAAFFNVKDLLVDGLEISGLPLGVGLGIHVAHGNSQVRNFHAHDFHSDTTLPALIKGAPNTTGLLIDADRVTDRPGRIGATDSLRIIHAKMHDITTGAAFQKANGGDQSDGLNIASHLTTGLVVEDFDIRRTGEAIDNFGRRGRFARGYIEDTPNFGLKCVHGAGYNDYSDIRIVRPGIAGIVCTAGDPPSFPDIEHNRFRHIRIEDVNGAGKAPAGASTAGILLGNGMPNGVTKVVENRFESIDITLGKRGKFGFLDGAHGRGNVGLDIAIEPGPSMDRKILVQFGGSIVQLRHSAGGARPH